MCCEAEWKREVVPDHKFDFLNVREFHRTDILTRLKYLWKYILVLKSVAVYGLDIFTAITMIASNHWTNAIQKNCTSDCLITVKFSIAKWIFVGCIIFSFLLLAYETYKARKVVQSRDISYAFTNLMANDYYSLKSYDNFCLFCHIDSSAKKMDGFAFFIYFTFKDWKRLLLADGPRQSINALILFSFAYSSHFQTSNLSAYYNGSPITAMLLLAMIATVLIFLGSLILLVVAAVFYIPLLCYIQGNLKEYVCHKVDKRITELIKKKQRERIRKNAALEKKLANGSYRPSKGETMPNMPQPTLPNVSLEDDDDDYRLKSKLEAEQGRSGVRRQKTDVMEYDIYGGAAPDYPPTSESSYPYMVNYDESTSGLTANAAPLGMSYPPMPPPPSKAPSYTTLAPRSYSPTPGAPAFPPSRSQNDLSRGYQPPQQPDYFGDMRQYTSEPSSYSDGQPTGRYPDSAPSRGYLDRQPTRGYTGGGGYGDGGYSGGRGGMSTSTSGNVVYDEPESLPYLSPTSSRGYGGGHGRGNSRDPNAGWGGGYR